MMIKTCPHCREHNPEGRERCQRCGGDLLQLDRIMRRDALARQAVGVLVPALVALKGAAIGAFGGFWLGAVIGALVQALSNNEGFAVGAMLLFALFGVAGGAALGALVGWWIVRKA
jgi:hypothetical protein